MSVEHEELTVEQELMYEVVNRIFDKYSYAQTDSLIKDAQKISDAILNYKNNK